MAQLHVGGAARQLGDGPAAHLAEGECLKLATAAHAEQSLEVLGLAPAFELLAAAGIGADQRRVQHGPEMLGGLPDGKQD